MSDQDRVYIYDCTLRDGAQTYGVDFTVADKIAVAEELDRLGVDYIEGGWPGANPTDDAFFGDLPKTRKARMTAFGMTRRFGRSADNDPGFQALFQTAARVVTIVGKTWDFHARTALGIEPEDNLSIIAESVRHGVARMDEIMFDAEHFFDGYAANPDYALACLDAALEAGARWIVLCDTNGGAIPERIGEAVERVVARIPGNRLGIHCHNDTETAVANSLAAVRAGVRQVQGTLNGLGERCGNANLVSVIPNLMLKMGMTTGISEQNLAQLTHVSRMFDERLNRQPNRHAAYVGEAAFAHKGGLHVSAIERDPRTYEHIAPELVGNRRQVVMSDQAGRSNVLARFREIGIEVDSADDRVRELLDEVKTREFAGYSYDGAEASFELLARRMLHQVPDFYRLHSFRVIDERRYNAKGDLVTISEATVRVYVNDDYYMEAADGHGPVDALNGALRKVILPFYPALEDMHLVDYKVRILQPEKGTGAITRVLIESADSSGRRWSTVGVSEDIIDASYKALGDAIRYRLMHAHLNDARKSA